MAPNTDELERDEHGNVIAYTSDEEVDSIDQQRYMNSHQMSGATEELEEN